MEGCRNAVDRLHEISTEKRREEAPATPPDEVRIIAKSVDDLRKILEKIERRSLVAETGLEKTIRDLNSTIHAKNARISRLSDKIDVLEATVREQIHLTRSQMRNPCLTSSDVKEIASATAKQVSDLMGKSSQSIEKKIESVAQFMEDVTATRFGGGKR